MEYFTAGSLYIVTFPRMYAFEIWLTFKDNNSVKRSKLVTQYFLKLLHDSEDINTELIENRINSLCKQFQNKWVKSSRAKKTVVAQNKEWLNAVERFELPRVDVAMSTFKHETPDKEPCGRPKKDFAKVCRICLSMDRKVFSLNKQLYQNVTGVVVPPLDRMPKYVCWECRHYLTKFFHFKSKAVTSHFILMEILSTQDITQSSLINYQTKSPLICTDTLKIQLEGPKYDKSKEINAIGRNDDVKYINQTDHIWEEQTDDITLDSDVLGVKTEVDDQTIDNLPKFAIVTIEETNETVFVDVNIKKEMDDNCIKNEDTLEIAKDHDIDACVETGNDMEITKGNDDSECIESDNSMETSEENYDSNCFESDNNMDINKGNDENESIESDNSMETNEENYDSNCFESDNNMESSEENYDSDCFESLNNMETKENVEKVTDIEPNIEKETDKNISSMEDLNQQLDDDTDDDDYDDNFDVETAKLKQITEENNSKSFGDTSTQSWKKGELDNTLLTVTTLTEEDQITEWRKRAENDEYLKAPYKCVTCFEGFADIVAYDGHMELHSKDRRPFECPVCKQRFGQRLAVTLHLKTHSLKIFCRKCDFVTNTHSLAYKHQVFHRGRRYECRVCGAVFAQTTSYFIHMRTKHPSNVLCQRCGRSFVSETGLRMHEVKVHNGDEKTIPEDGPFCERCDLRFLSQEAFDTHKIWSANHINDARVGKKIPRYKRKKPPKVTKAGPYPCEQCDEVLPDTKAYHKHFKTKHKGQTRTVFFNKYHNLMCEICGQICQSVGGLRLHQERHRRGNCYKCERCCKEFSKMCFLKNHMEKRCGKKLQLPCKVCGRIFSCRHKHSRHMETHRGIIHKCEVCHKEFQHAADKRNHVKYVHKKIPRPQRKTVNKKKPKKRPVPEQKKSSSEDEVNNSNSNTRSN